MITDDDLKVLEIKRLLKLDSQLVYTVKFDRKSPENTINYLVDLLHKQSIKVNTAILPIVILEQIASIRYFASIHYETYKNSPLRMPYNLTLENAYGSILLQSSNLHNDEIRFDISIMNA